MIKKIQNQFMCSKFMLPEHVEMLERHAREQEEKEICHLPAFDEQLLEEWDMLLNQSVREGVEIKITLLTDRQRKQLSGKVAWIKGNEGRIGLQTEGGIKGIYVKNIIWMEQA